MSIPVSGTAGYKPDNPHVEQVIVTRICRGKGVAPNPIRCVTQIHGPDGTFIAENDPCPPISRLREAVYPELHGVPTGYSDEHLVDRVIEMLQDIPRLQGLARQPTLPHAEAEALAQAVEKDWNTILAATGAAAEFKLALLAKVDFGAIPKALEAYRKRFPKQEAKPAPPEPRMEQCVICRKLVSDWVDPDWSHGRICRPCETKHEPKQESKP